MRYWMKEWIEPIIIAVILALIIRTFVVQAFKIPTGSMRPTLIEGDRILVSKFIYKFREPKRGEVIVFISPEDKKKDFIKRLVGLPNENIQLSNGAILVNNAPVEECPLLKKQYYYNRGDFGAERQIVTIPNDAYYVLGDNSLSSRDSRYWGFMPKKFLLGKAFLIYWPPNRIGIVK
ncbi:MAG: signal peptidase I [Candidatus Omnitrophica bacterium CG02_land_8_20_14_3_00__42_8]|nr:MAG: signal peptidase I [Candidatus Omnitrophica bacterium CG02_land_8_20_14_3_00__42_8]PIW67234.1 MAG: signal peptidase I [Candidatus Omnitrophica bacterium CG12_big_fil_rev_8_21_14_0_65_42_8]